jgi:UPF0755 protein
MKNEIIQPETNQAKRKKSWFHKIILGGLGIAIVISLIVAFLLYKTMFLPNVRTPNHQDFSIYIRTGAGFNEVKQNLFEQGLITDKNSFLWLAERKNYPAKVKAGRYIIRNGMSNEALINLLRSGAQTPIKLTFNNVRDIRQLAGRISKQIEADSVSLLKMMNNAEFMQKSGFNRETMPAMFLPNTYEFYWNINAEAFVSRMFQEYLSYWNENRKKTAKAILLKPVEVSVLASIIDRETSVDSEKAMIAGVYLNRLKDNWLLQADPTLIFALNDYTIRRVLDVHKNIESKYNTYKYPGLPPGPICIPTLSAIEAVLNYQKHNYYYFCAKDDFSGKHAFAKTYNEHMVNARKFQQALNNQKIYR